jgi:hypothetical protein
MSELFIPNTRMISKRTSELGILSAGSFFVRLDIEYFAGICRIGVERLKRKIVGNGKVKRSSKEEVW